MQKIIKRYIYILGLLFGTMGYGQVDGPKYKFKAQISPSTNNTVTVTVTVTNTVTNSVSFLQTMPVVLYNPPPITAPTINIHEVLSNPSSSEEDKAKAHEALAIQEAQEAQAAAAMAQIQSLLAWVEAQSQSQSQPQSQAQAQSQAEGVLTSLQQISQSIANGGTAIVVTNPSLPTWYMDYDNDGYHGYTQQKATPPGAFGWKSTTNGPDCNDNDAQKNTDCSGALPIIGWFLDNDRDGYHAEAKGATTQPTPGNWTTTMTKGLDCNDNLFSADNSVCSVLIQGTNTSNPGKDYVPKSTDKLVKVGIVATCAIQSKLPACVLTSLEVTLNNVLGLTVTSKEITTAAWLSTLDPNYLENGLNPAQTIQFINSFCITETLVKADYKTAIDTGKTFLTDIKTGTEITPDKDFPDDRSKDKTTIISHSVSVIGYDVDGNYIYIDPALGKAQVAPPADMGFSYSIIIKGKK